VNLPNLDARFSKEGQGAVPEWILGVVDHLYQAGVDN
jgi:hypothetical protein